MIRALSTAATGMEAQQRKLDVTANNVANVSTPGFKKGRAEFQDLMYQTIRSPGAQTSPTTQAPTGLQIGLGVRTVGVQRVHTEGSMTRTNNQLDVAIEGNGFFQITMPNGDQAYTRDGSFKKAADGSLVTSDGFALAGGIIIPDDARDVTIAADGTVSVSVLSGTGVTTSELGRLQLVSFANPAGLSAAGRNLFRETTASGTATPGAPTENGLGSLAQGMLELSNVQAVEEMIDLISGQRAYEINSRVIRAADDMLQSTAQLK